MEENNKDNVDSGEAQIYEIGYHLLPTVAESELSAEVSKIHSAITGAKGSIIGEGFPEIRALAYDISKRIETKHTHFNRAYFGWVKFEVERSLLSKIESALTTNPNVLRFLTIKTVKENTMYVPKMVSIKKEDSIEPTVSGTEEKVEKAPASAEEIDKSIDELVIS